MSLKIIILNTNNQSDGSFSISGVFWLTAPESLTIPLPSFKSQVANITSTQLTALQNGTIVETHFNTGLYPSGTTLADVKIDLQSLYDSAQTKLNNSIPPSTGFVGAVFDGTSWSISTEPLYVESQLVNISEPKDPRGIPLTIPEPRTGSETIYSTHNFCDKVSWFSNSTRVNNKTLTSSDGYRWDSGDTYWIDMVTGRVQDDDGLADEQAIFEPGDPHRYQVIVTVDGVAKTIHEPFFMSGQDYEVFWEDGYIKSLEDWTGKTVVASYSKCNGSTFILRPLPGTILNIEAAEADFTTDTIIKDSIEYSIWGYAAVFAPQLGLPDGTKIPLKSGKYKRLGQIMDEAIGAYPLIGVYGCSDTERNLPMKEFRRQSRGLKSFVQSIPFRYATVRSLQSSYGLELRIKLLNDIEFEGSLATLTFYCTALAE